MPAGANYPQAVGPWRVGLGTPLALLPLGALSAGVHQDVSEGRTPLPLLVLQGSEVT